ncbi:glycine oxidase ThiO [Ktedonobacter robiniae]|uniref:glycine oxidase n=1 Tax=Ktedonobacter robiniae TaxID=2778365 RepID=A0ABQ3V335_9CHLR|nr:glycine oxidase ThiO [Ktedonobacter robiniae]GHO59289.1 glycine oxidase ThiO [Ktedonobacter robiniae]
MKQSADVLIVGGGVIGCSIAYFLRKLGIEVIVLEKGEIGAQSSSAAAGLLAPMRPLGEADAFKLLQIAGMRRLASFVPELEEVSGISVEYERTGTLRILPPEKIVSAKEWAREWCGKGFQIETLSPEETRDCEPHLFPGVQGAVYIADEAQVTPVLLMSAVARAAQAQGAFLHDHTEVVSIQISKDGNRVTGVQTRRGELFTCGHLVIAAGAWSSQFSSWLRMPIPVRPVRGELVSLRQPSPPLLKRMIFDEGVYDIDVYISPKPNGTVVIGATKAEVGYDTSVSVGGVLHLLDVATRLIPALAHCTIERTWAGLRPKTPDSRPILGRIPAWENVTLATGHGGFGVTMSALTGECIAHLIASGQTSEVIGPFAPRLG